MSISTSDAVKFLERDFNQCFAQIRHYDCQIWNICRFAFTVYITILGAAIGIYQYSIEKQVNLAPAAASILVVGLLSGLLLYYLALCNRVYYVQVCRYVNEHRRLFVAAKPLGFENSSGMYVATDTPRYHNWMSWQSWLSSLIAFLNAIFGAVLVYYSTSECSWQLALSALCCALIATFQIGLGTPLSKVLREKNGNGNDNDNESFQIRGKWYGTAASSERRLCRCQRNRNKQWHILGRLP